MRAIFVPADREQPMTEVQISDDRPLLSIYNALNQGTTIVERVIVGDPSVRRRFDNMVMLVDEEGATPWKQLPRNTRASFLYGIHFHGTAIYGNALLIGEDVVYDPEEGPGVDFTDLPERYTVESVDRYLNFGTSDPLLTS